MTDEPGTPASLPTAPIFVIGSARSGTTMLRLMLDSHARISSGEETHFLQQMEPVVGKQWRLLERYGFPREYWLDRLRHLYGDFQAEYAARRGKARWADKDPANTLLLPFVEELFPDAQYIHLVRDGHDVVASHRDRWGYRSGVRSARGAWRKYVEAARSFGAEAGPGRFLEVRYEALVTDTETELRRLFTFLGEAWDPTGAGIRPGGARRDGALHPVHRRAPGAGWRGRRGVPVTGRRRTGESGSGATDDAPPEFRITAGRTRLHRRLTPWRRTPWRRTPTAGRGDPLRQAGPPPA